MSQHAKSVIAAFAAVVFVAITSWQQVVVGGPFRWVDLVPVAVVVVGAIQTRVIPNVPELPWAKAVANGSSAVLTAIATLIASDPSGVTAGKLLTVAAGAFLVWFVPEFGGPELAPLTEDGAHVVTDLPPVPAHVPAPLTTDQLQTWLDELKAGEEPEDGPDTPSGSSSPNAPAPAPAAALAPPPLPAEPPTAPMKAVAAGAPTATA